MNGDRIEGQFRNDVVEGWATLYCKNGDWFEGHWSKGMREGPGVWYFESREQCYRGEWHENVPKFGVVEDLPKKETNATSSFLPTIETKDYVSILAQEKRKLDEKRRQRMEECGETWEAPPEEADHQAESEEQVSW